MPMSLLLAITAAAKAASVEATGDLAEIVRALFFAEVLVVGRRHQLETDE